MSDQQIACSECGDTFVFTEAEQSFYQEKGLASPPKRCKTCRQARKAASGNGGGGGGFGRSNGPPRRGNDSRDARGPGGGGSSWAPRGAPAGGQSSYGASAPRAGHAPRGGAFDARGPRNGPPGRSDARGDSRGGDSRGPNGRGPNPRGPNARGPSRSPSGNGSSEYRSPAFPEQRWAPAPASSRDDGARGNGGGNAKRGRDGNASSPPVARAERPERPKYDIKCGECGVGAQVPFKPIEGRDVFCQECYRARRGTARAATEVADAAPDADGGIVE